ncbi:hypothetical protein VTH82DRAFT_6405 [Thermothelomyces myriococcoides]
MAQQQSLSSNNPFRRKLVSSAPAAPPAAVPRFADFDESPGPTVGVEPDLPRADLFRHQLQSLSGSAQPPPETSFRKLKVVKKVRVQSPPSSPSSSPEGDSSAEDSGSISHNDESRDNGDPFERASSSTDSEDVSDGEEDDDDPQPLSAHRTPPNPFEKTLKDLNAAESAESEQAVPDQTSKSRGVLDVDAFGRLLLTGQAGVAAPSQVTSPSDEHAKHPPGLDNNGATARDSSSASRSPTSGSLQVAQDSPQPSRETSGHVGQNDRRGSGSSVQSSTLPNVQTTPPPHPKRKPPPPSSRHGKLINPGPTGVAVDSKQIAGGTQAPPVASPDRRVVTTTTGLTPTSPPSPHSTQRSLSSASQESPVDEASEIQPGPNIVASPRPPTPPNASHAKVTGTQPSKKPAPPPRRQPHGRSESKTTTTSNTVSTAQHDDSESTRRSSIDSTKSRSSSSVRVGMQAPAPPPPRRPSHTSRGSISSSGVPPPPPTAPSEDGGPTVLLGAPVVPSPPTISDSPGSSGSSTPAPAVTAPGTTTTTSSSSSTSTTKPVPPPPPPARNTSVRAKRPASNRTTLPVSPPPSSSSPDASGLVRRSSGSRGKEPPPPPTRHRDRGNSRASVESASATSAVVAAAAAAAAASGSGSGSAGSQQVVPEAERSAADGPLGPAGMTESHVGDLLADLNALQREVDALRGKVEKKAG